MVETYAEAVAFIHSRSTFKKVPTLSRMKQFLALLGHPQDQLNVIHVAGTNGKGSTVAFIRDLLMASGQTVGSFTSPYMMKFNERISVDGIPVSDETILTLVNQIQPIVARLDDELPEGGPTEFEVITGMMFWYFAHHPVDTVIVEVGIGGLLDSTNVMIPRLTVITTVGYDHMQLLGQTLAEIASQKAGIIKAGVPLIIGQLPETARTVVRQLATAQDAPLTELGVDFKTNHHRRPGWHEVFDFSDQFGMVKDLQIQLLGDYQVANASIAIEVARLYLAQTDQVLPSKDIRRALKKTQWPGRFEALNQAPLIVIDGAHNEPAVLELKHLLEERFGQQDIYIILAILEDKQYSKMVQTLLTLPNVHLILTQFQGPGKRPVASLSELIAAADGNQRVQVADSWQVALQQTLQVMSAEDLLLLTGSLYFVSDVRQYFVDAQI